MQEGRCGTRWRHEVSAFLQVNVTSHELFITFFPFFLDQISLFFFFFKLDKTCYVPHLVLLLCQLQNFKTKQHLSIQGIGAKSPSYQSVESKIIFYSVAGSLARGKNV